METNISGIEIETKFHVRDLKKIGSRLQELGARLIQPRIFEINLRFDMPDSTLGKSYRVLRLRQDTQAVLTYKGPGQKPDSGIRAREEWEVVVSDFETMQKILESLGYIVWFEYEKYRTTYIIDQAHIMLDELPFGNFVEIEGQSTESILSLADQLGLDRKAAVPDSYQVLFEQTRNRYAFTFRDLKFENYPGPNTYAVLAPFADES